MCVSPEVAVLQSTKYACVMCTGVWEAFKKLQDHVLKNLAAFLKITVFAGWAPTTITKYMYAFLKWKHWAESKDEIPVFPASEIHVALT